MPTFWALPPEINSTPDISGPAWSDTTAAQGWNALASELW